MDRKASAGLAIFAALFVVATGFLSYAHYQGLTPPETGMDNFEYCQHLPTPSYRPRTGEVTPFREEPEPWGKLHQKVQLKGSKPARTTPRPTSK